MPWFKRRLFLGGLMAVTALPASLQLPPAMAQTAEVPWRQAEAGAMTFRWRHLEDALRGRLMAPTSGWLAVGFNDAERLKDTCFIMAQLSQRPVRVEIRRAVVPHHVLLEDADVQDSLVIERARFQQGQSQLDFRLPYRSAAAMKVRLTAGSPTYLMLAWSHSTDFEHHSAFREHQRVTL